MSKRKRLILRRNWIEHQRFFHKFPPNGPVYCSRCADVYCLRNITPTRLLPRDSKLGKLRQRTCKEMLRDRALPVDLG